MNTPAYLNYAVPADSFSIWLASIGNNPFTVDLLIIANKLDHMINQELSIKFAGMANAVLVVMDNDLGHLIFDEKIPIEATQKFLSH
jgi:hypothetical protein